MEYVIHVKKVNNYYSFFYILKSQIVTSSWGGRRYNPYSFTEQVNDNTKKLEKQITKEDVENIINSFTEIKQKEILILNGQQVE